MDLSTLLTSDAVRVVTDVTSKKRLFQTIAEIAEPLSDVPSGRILEALLDRENLGPTGVGHGIALPHARLAQIDRVMGLFIRLERQIDFDATDRQPVDLVFVLLAPEETGVDHLKALALVARTLRDPALCTKLRSTNDPMALYALLTSAEATKAA